MTCHKLAALEVVRVADVVVAEAAHPIVVERLDAAADVGVELETAVRRSQHLHNVISDI